VLSYTGLSVRSIQQFSHGVLADIVRRQPSTPARTTFAWQLVVGPALAKATTVELVDGVLKVRSTDARWTLEINRARGMVLARLQHLLGAGAITALHIEQDSGTRERTSRT
jgi:hypothetical protein